MANRLSEQKAPPEQLVMVIPVSQEASPTPAPNKSRKGVLISLSMLILGVGFGTGASIHFFTSFLPQASQRQVVAQLIVCMASFFSLCYVLTTVTSRGPKSKHQELRSWSHLFCIQSTTFWLAAQVTLIFAHGGLTVNIPFGLGTAAFGICMLAHLIILCLRRSKSKDQPPKEASVTPVASSNVSFISERTMVDDAASACSKGTMSSRSSRISVVSRVPSRKPVPPPQRPKGPRPISGEKEGVVVVVPVGSEEKSKSIEVTVSADVEKQEIGDGKDGGKVVVEEERGWFFMPGRYVTS